LLLGVMVVTRPCRAEESPDKAAAEALYQLGQQLLKSGDFTNACPKLEASNSLDPGVGTLLLLGDCQEKLGKLASAWATFREAAGLATSRGDADRARVADLRAAALKPRLVSVIFKVDSGNEGAGFELKRNAAVISKGSWGVPLPTDVGRYEIVASAPDREPWRTTIDVPAKLDEPLVVQVPLLAPSATRSTLGGRKSTSAVPGEATRSTGSGQRTVGVIVASVGIAAAITSGVLTGLASAKNKDSKGNCDATNPNLCSQLGVTQREDAKKMAGFATAFGIGGAAAIGTGAVLFLFAPRSDAGNVTGLVLGLSGGF
jgi:serine/threonine-protein kinase